MTTVDNTLKAFIQRALEELEVVGDMPAVIQPEGYVAGILFALERFGYAKRLDGGDHVKATRSMLKEEDVHSEVEDIIRTVRN